MKIAFLIPSLKGGGAERFTANISNKLCENQNNNIFVITGQAKQGDYPLNAKINRGILLTGNLLKDILRVRKFLKVNRINICVGIDIYANLILSINNKRLKTVTVLSERTAPSHMPYSKITKILRALFFKNADYYVFQTQDAKAFYSESIQRRSFVIPNPIKEGLPRRIDPIDMQIVAAGRLDKVKNYELLLRAFKNVFEMHPEYMLRIFGDGDQMDHLVKYANELGIQKAVVFEGFSNNVHERIMHSDIYVLTSDLEGMPNSLLEAMGMGFPVVSTDCPAGGPRELIGENENGLLVPVGDADRLSKAIKKLIEDREMNRLLGEKAYEKSKDYFIDVIGDSWERALNRMAVAKIREEIRTNGI